MKKFFSGLLASMLLLPSVAMAELTTTEAADLLGQTTYWFGVKRQSYPNQGFCTASKIGPREYLTAKHCAENIANDFRLISPTGNYVFIRSVLISASNKADGKRWEDWAILIGSDESDAPSLTLGCGETPFVGQPVASMGYPEGLSKSFVKGYISTLEKGRGGNDASYFVDLPVAPGASGAPLISMLNGQLIGVVTEGVINWRTREFYMTGIESIESLDACEDWSRRMKHWGTDEETGFEFVPSQPKTKDVLPPNDWT